jgi:RNA polymerase sigma factor (TIGR02999 family)
VAISREPSPLAPRLSPLAPLCSIIVSDVTKVLEALEQGSPQAASRLLPLVYDELRRLAARELAREKPGQTLDPTALVHEAYLRLVGPSDGRRYADRGHFCAAAAQAMRRILVDNARRKQRAKHGGDLRRVQLEDVVPALPSAAEDILALDEALSRLESQDPDAAALVQLRYFAGLSVEQAARNLGIPRATAYRHWTFARAWLLHEVAGDRSS